MNINDLPAGTAPAALAFGHFPARHQAVIWRNWGVVSAKRLAGVLNASEDDIIDAAAEMGLGGVPDLESRWLELGYASIIRANWHLLDYEQLLQLLGWTPEKLSFHLKEDDFLWIKLGSLKPDCGKAVFRRLTPAEAAETGRVGERVVRFFGEAARGELPFDFIDKLGAEEHSRAHTQLQPPAKFGTNFIYSYFAAYGDPLGSPGNDPLPEGLLKRYSEMGVQGVWMPAILYMLSPIKEAPEFSEGWEKRIENLNAVIRRAGKYGLNVFLYLNEPRAMFPSFFNNLPSWKGAYSKRNGGTHALCTSSPGVLEWLRNSCGHLFKNAPELAGVFTITMSENLTNCRSKVMDSPCPRCAERPVEAIVAEVNNAIEEGVHAASPGARVICWDWAWDDAWEHEAVDLLSEKLEFMCVSEWGKEINIGGVDNRIRDYSISSPGPSGRSLSAWSRAAARGMKTLAKVQLNTSWECSALPYLPVPYLVEEHLDNLRSAGVDGLMLSWSLGGYPGGNLELLNHTPAELAVRDYGEEAAESIKAAWKMFGEAFRNFPFEIAVLYFGPQNMGPANLLWKEDTGYESTMVGFPYDDLERWRANYPGDVFENQFKLLSEGWKSGLEKLHEASAPVPEAKRANYAGLRNVAEAAYCHFRSAYNQVRFIRLRGNPDASAEINAILDEEVEISVKMHTIVMSDSTIGFEATNHYAYTANDLMEKVLNCLHLKQYYSGVGNHES